VRFRHAVRVVSLTILGAGLAHATALSYSISCAQVTLGPVTILANAYSSNDSGFAPLALVPNIPLNHVALIPATQTTRIDSVANGVFTGTLSCAIALGGVSSTFTRSLSLDTAAKSIMVGAVNLTLNLGAHGKVRMSAPAETLAGYDPALAGGGFLILPLSNTGTIVLTPPPISVLPEPPPLTLSLVGLAAGGMHWAGRRARS